MQICPKVLGGTGYWDFTPQVSSVVDGAGAPPVSGGGVPMLVGGTVKNLVMYDGVGIPEDVTVEIYKNFSPTGLSVMLPAGIAGRQTFNDSVVVSFSPGDYIDYFVSAGLISSPGTIVGICSRIDSTALMWGAGGFVGTPVNGDGFIAEAFGNGNLGSYGGDPSAVGGSICAINGTITRIGINRFASATGGSWRARIIKNGVLQDGTGGTPDSTFVLNDTDAAYGSGNISVSCAIWDRVTILLQRLGTTSAFSLRQAAVGIAFRPAIAGQFMICEGDNAEIATSGTHYKWIDGADSAIEGASTAPAGRSTFSFTAMYVDHIGAGTNTLLKNSEPTLLTTTVAGGDQFSDITNVFARFSAADLMTFEMVDGANRLHFSLGASEGSRAGTIGPLAWVHWPRRIP